MTLTFTPDCDHDALLGRMRKHMTFEPQAVKVFEIGGTSVIMSVSAIPWDEVTTSKFEGVKRDFVVPERFQDSSSLLTDDAQQLERLVQEIHHCKVVPLPHHLY